MIPFPIFPIAWWRFCLLLPVSRPRRRRQPTTKGYETRVERIRRGGCGWAWQSIEVWSFYGRRWDGTGKDLSNVLEGNYIIIPSFHRWWRPPEILWAKGRGVKPYCTSEWLVPGSSSPPFNFSDFISGLILFYYYLSKERRDSEILAQMDEKLSKCICQQVENGGGILLKENPAINFRFVNSFDPHSANYGLSREKRLLEGCLLVICAVYGTETGRGAPCCSLRVWTFQFDNGEGGSEDLQTI